MEKNIGKAMNQPLYDVCKTHIQIIDSVSPMGYQMYQGKFVNDVRCGGNKGVSLSERIDRESELKNITRPLSDCAEMKYQPGCDNKICKDTFKMNNDPIPFDICPIVFNNMPKIKNPGFLMKNTF